MNTAADFSTRIGTYVQNVLVSLAVTMLLSSCATMPVGPSGSIAPKNSAETEIFYQAVATGAIVGGAAGALIGKKTNDTSGAIAGGILGAVVGGLIGREIAKQQIADLRNVKLETDRMEMLLANARKYNKEISDYNRQLRVDISNLKKQSQDQQSRLAQQKLREAEQSRENLQESIDDRAKIANTLESSQQRKYKQELKQLEKEEQKMDQYIAELKKIDEEGRAQTGKIRTI